MEEFDKNFETENEEEADPEKVDDLEDPEAGFPEEDMYGDSEPKDEW